MAAWLQRLALAAMLTTAAIMPAEAAREPQVPETLYEWVQSSARMNYFFNKEQIHYDVDEHGVIDLNRLIVPTLKTYDAVQVDDIIEKRRWRDQPTDGYEDLAGEANYIRIDLKKRQVTIDAVDLLDSHLTTLERTTPGLVVKLADLTPQNLNRVFYEKIIEYTEQHRDEIIARTKGELSEHDRKMIENEAKEREKQLEKERKAAEKEARERAKEEKRRRK